METSHEATDLELEQDLDFARRSWRIKRAGWIGMLAVVVAALLGLFGINGPLSRGTAGRPGGPLWIEYERFGRYLAPMSLDVHVRPAARQGGEVRLWVSRDLLADCEIQAITPEPERSQAGPDRLLYVFAAAPSGEPVQIGFGLKPERIGRLEGRIGLAGGAQESFAIFIYP